MAIMNFPMHFLFMKGNDSSDEIMKNKKNKLF